jgi:hypothetical protein
MIAGQAAADWFQKKAKPLKMKSINMDHNRDRM